MQPQPMRSANGVLILILGIFSFVFCGIFTAIPAWVMGNNALKDIDAGYADPNERGMVQAGRILGIINVCVCVVAILAWIVFILFFGVALTQMAPPRR